jgi:hypothetical protein
VTLRVAELETLFTADLTPFEKGAKQVDQRRQAMAKGDTTVTVAADVRSAVTDLDRVLAEVQSVGALDPTVLVDADAAAALGDLSKVATEARSLPDGELQVTADTSSAQGALNKLSSDAQDGASEAGDKAGSNLAGGIVAALATIPVAGAIVGIGAAIGDSLLEGLQNEVRADRFAAQTGLDEATTARIGRAAGEAYASNFGDSIESNLDAARMAVQSGLLDPNATARDAQKVIEQLTGVSDLLGEEYPRVARSAAQAVKTGIARDAAGAFDVLVKAQQAGLNVSEDLLDTVDEYGTQFRKVGLDGPQAFGLIAQAVRAGARDTDIAADSLKEFSIRAVDGSDLTRESFDALGLSASDMTDRIAAGGPRAAEALDVTLDRLRGVEDPAKRAQIAVGLFGTQAEDMGEALYAMDLSTAVEQLGQVEGAADRALTTLGDNSAGKIAEAQRNIALAADGIQGALATAFAPQIEGFATFVTENRTAVIQFLLDSANGAIDFGKSIVEAAASGTEAVGDFLGGPMSDLIDALATAAEGVDGVLPGDQGGADFRAWADDAIASLNDIDSGSETAADNMRRNLIENTLDPAQDKLNSLGDGMLLDARLHDATTALVADLDALGYAADGSQLAIGNLNMANLTATEQGAALDAQLRTVSEGLGLQLEAAAAAGEGQESLRQRYEDTRGALVNQLEQMGLTTEQANALADAYGLIPETVDTVVTAETKAAEDRIASFVNPPGGPRRIPVIVDMHGGNPVYSSAPGNKSVMRFEAQGDILSTGLTPMSGSLAQIVPPNTWRVVGDRARDDELFAPLDGSARSHALMAEGARRMGARYLPMADGAVLGATQTVREGPLVQLHVERVVEGTPQDVADATTWALTKAGL